MVSAGSPCVPGVFTASVLRLDQVAIMPAGLTSLAAWGGTSIPDYGTTKDVSRSGFLNTCGGGQRECGRERSEKLSELVSLVQVPC